MLTFKSRFLRHAQIVAASMLVSLVFSPLAANAILPGPTITAAKITVSGASGTTGTFIIGDTATVQWDDTSTGDNSANVSGATANLTAWGGSASTVMSSS